MKTMRTPYIVALGVAAALTLSSCATSEEEQGSSPTTSTPVPASSSSPQPSPSSSAQDGSIQKKQETLKNAVLGEKDTPQGFAYQESPLGEEGARQQYTQLATSFNESMKTWTFNPEACREVMMASFAAEVVTPENFNTAAMAVYMDEKAQGMGGSNITVTLIDAENLGEFKKPEFSACPDVFEAQGEVMQTALAAKYKITALPVELRGADSYFAVESEGRVSTSPQQQGPLQKQYAIIGRSKGVEFIVNAQGDVPPEQLQSVAQAQVDKLS